MFAHRCTYTYLYRIEIARNTDIHRERKMS